MFNKEKRHTLIERFDRSVRLFENGGGFEQEFRVLKEAERFISVNDVEVNVRHQHGILRTIPGLGKSKN